MAFSRLSFAASLVLFSSLIISSVAYYGNDEADPETGKLIPMAFEGIIMCKSGGKTYPIQGATARISCVKKDLYGKELVPISIMSTKTDAKGYFFASIFPSQLHAGRTVGNCKAFLDKSPLADCNFRTNVNNGIKGQTLNMYRVLQDKSFKLYWVSTFFFTSEPTYY